MNASLQPAIQAYFSDDGPGEAIPADIARLGALAGWDLWYGPIAKECWDGYGPDDGEPWPGFTDATAAVAAWADEHVPYVLFYDADADFLSEDDPFEDRANYEEPVTGDPTSIYFGPEDVRRLERRDILASLFDTELVRGGYLD